MTCGYAVSFCTVYIWFISYNKHQLGPLLVQEYISPWPAADVSSAGKINTTVTCTHGSFMIYLIHVVLNSKGLYRFLRIFSFLCLSPADYNVIANATSNLFRDVILSSRWSYLRTRSWLVPSRPSLSIGRETAPSRARYAKTTGDESGLEEHFSPPQLFLT